MKEVHRKLSPPLLVSLRGSQAPFFLCGQTGKVPTRQGISQGLNSVTTGRRRMITGIRQAFTMHQSPADSQESSKNSI